FQIKDTPHPQRIRKQMARYKKFSYEQARFIPIHFDKQILPGTFEYTLSYLIDNEIDLSLFDNHYNNDDTGAPAYDPAILLKILFYAYSRGNGVKSTIDPLKIRGNGVKSTIDPLKIKCYILQHVTTT
ncbi:MAG: hypothetical protein L6406_20000, partial [Desulfobacterales bacterium]|nr:hypothetical protein [Pseudomonadota bacterium]MCG2777959.1 hypothetical protein [Desulfobacterales bacterium]